MSGGNKSPLPPAVSRGPVKTLTTTQVLTFTKYSKAALLPAGEVLRSKPFDFHGRSWRVKVYPTGFGSDARDFVAVFVKCRTEPFQRFRADVKIEILDKTGKNTVFDDATASSMLMTADEGFSKGYIKFARRRELEASSCIHNDSFMVRCTLLVDAKVTKPSSLLPWRCTTTKVDDNDRVPAPSLTKSSAPHSAAATEQAASTTGGAPEIVTGSHTLTISGFSEKKASLAFGECVRSLQFSVGGSNWYMKVYPNGYGDGDRDSVSFVLARGKSVEPATTAEFTFELVNFAEVGNNKSAKVKETFDRAKSERLGFQLLAADLQSARQMSNDRLVVRCKLGVFKGKAPSPLLAEVPTIAVPPNDGSDFLRLLLSEEGSDITFAVGDTTFRAHSCILAAQSPVLRAELRALTEDPACAWRYIEVHEEVTAEAFEALLHIAYTDHLPDMRHVEPTEERVAAMVFAAEKYEMERLKLRCEEWVCTFLSVFTVADILSMAVRYDCQLLKAACVEYATPDHMWDLVKETDGFKRLKGTCPQIVREIESKQRQY